MTCIHCGYVATTSALHICKAVVREWVGRLMFHAPSAAYLIADDLLWLQATGQHLWRPNVVPFSQEVL